MTRIRRRSNRWLLIATLSTASLPAGAWLVAGSARADAPADLGGSDAPAAPSPRTPVVRPTSSPAKGPATTRATTQPTTAKSAKDLSAEDMLSQMLKAPQQAGKRPLSPLPSAASGGPDKKSGPGAVAPSAPVVNVLREGTFLVDRLGRLNRSADGSKAEFTFDADGTALQDPPVVIVPNLKLQQMEDAAANAVKDPRFRVSGMLTEYRGRNYIVLDKVVAIPDILEKF